MVIMSCEFWRSYLTGRDGRTSLKKENVKKITFCLEASMEAQSKNFICDAQKHSTVHKQRTPKKAAKETEEHKNDLILNDQ